MAGKRQYGDGCANAHALELIGERWALLVIRELMLGPRRFTDLRSALPGISPNVLTQRLDELERASIVVRKRLPPPVSTRAYDLTAWGRELEPIMQSIGRWAVRSPRMPLGQPLSVNSLILSFRTMFDPTMAQGMCARIGIIVNGQEFVAAMDKASLSLEPGETASCDASIAGDPNMIGAVVYGGAPLDSAISKGMVTIAGDATLIRRFVRLFPLPERAPDLAKDLR